MSGSGGDSVNAERSSAGGGSHPGGNDERNSMTAPTLKNGTALPFPAVGNNYTKVEIIGIMVKYGVSRKDLIKAISDARRKSGNKLGPAQSTLYRFFPTHDGRDLFNEDELKSLLRRFEVGSDQWIERVTAISRSEFGPGVSEIHAIFRYEEQAEAVESTESEAAVEAATHNDAVSTSNPTNDALSESASVAIAARV